MSVDWRSVLRRADIRRLRILSQRGSGAFDAEPRMRRESCAGRFWLGLSGAHGAGKRFFSTAGQPATSVDGSTFVITTAPAATTAPSPITTRGMIDAPVPMNELRRQTTPPARLQPGEM